MLVGNVAAKVRMKIMAHLSYPSLMDVQLRLDANEDAILTVVRGCPWWHKADVEGRCVGSTWSEPH
jgi:hypothetical protein